MYTGDMAYTKSTTGHVSKKASRQSVALPASISEQVRKIASDRRLSANRVMVELIEAGINAHEREKENFMALAEELATTRSVRRRKEIKQALARLTFGE
ncbi:MAG: hypothetical protein HYU27_07180 [Acidobacteria bacterium]|nr:hypothetical protein [Acidobacteriota bacterium]